MHIDSVANTQTIPANICFFFPRSRTKKRVSLLHLLLLVGIENVNSSIIYSFKAYCFSSQFWCVYGSKNCSCTNSSRLNNASSSSSIDEEVSWPEQQLTYVACPLFSGTSIQRSPFGGGCGCGRVHICVCVCVWGYERDGRMKK